ncbi:hypothetical protein H8B15_03570 [Hymenobacter sp. BT507]|uniref:DUF3098 domain-containing protein n=1 Tax=Hymenobacter citatus TaxID=2763506 RepID=A0ABR7MGW3_9BACT|nr:hypothetical protein [Hymenobacter citatus]MBC6609985.1 hypothetical protein [Hymenobacter citatus]
MKLIHPLLLIGLLFAGISFGISLGAGLATAETGTMLSSAAYLPLAISGGLIMLLLLQAFGKQKPVL